MGTDSNRATRALAPYVPNGIIDWLRHAERGAIHTSSPHSGVVACIDASGFTALTRSLAEFGKEGPEILTARLNAFFEAMSSETLRCGGDVLKFAGDALWAFFPSRLDAGSFHASLLAAMGRVNASAGEDNQYPLSIHVGAEYGSFHLASLGRAGVRVEAEPCGDLLAKVYEACDLAGTNQFVVGPELARLLELEATEPLGDGYHVVPPADRDQSEQFASNAVRTLPDNLDLAPFVSPDVAHRLLSASSDATLQSEFRQVTVLFANFEYPFPEDTRRFPTAIKELNKTLERVFEGADKRAGSVARIDPYQGGHKLLILFGAPVQGENDELSAVACAREMMALSDARFRLRIGLARGSLFCGEVGGSRRREYTVMGDAINMAARLMSKSDWNQALIDDRLRQKLPEEIVTETRRLSLKGIGEEVACHQLVGVAEAQTRAETTRTTVGQDDELAALRSAWHRAANGSLQMIRLHGVAGVGKTTLTGRLLEEIGTPAPYQLRIEGWQDPTPAPHCPVVDAGGRSKS